MVAWLDSLLHSVGPVAYLVLFGAALIEYVIPPFPGDTITLLGGVYAVRGEKPWWLVFAAVTLGSVVGSAIDYFVGMRIRRRVEQGKPTVGMTAERIAAIHERVGRGGPWLIVANRFLPGVRSMAFVGGGLIGLPFGRVMLLGAVSAAAWNVLLMALGIALGGNVERLEDWVSRYNRIALVGVAVVVSLVVARIVYRGRKRRADAAEGTSRE